MHDLRKFARYFLPYKVSLVVGILCIVASVVFNLYIPLIVGDAIADGRLVRVLPGFAAMRGDIWAVYPSHRHLSSKVRLFVDHIAGWFK